MITVRPSTFSEIQQAPNIESVLAGYYAESAIPEIEKHKVGVQWPMYEGLESTGRLVVYAAWDGDTLAGSLIFLDSMLPHYGVDVAIVESYYVLPEYRKTGAGLKLLVEAELEATRRGAKAFMASAPIGGRLAEVLPGLGYRETNRVFARALV